MYTLELHLLLSRERQILEVLPKLIDVSTNENLKTALEGRRDQTETQARALEGILTAHGESIPESNASAEGKTCNSMKTMLGEGGDIIEMVKDDEGARDVAIIDGARTVEHFKLGRYKIVCELAGVLEHEDDKTTLDELYENGENAVKALSELAKDGVLEAGANEA